MRWVRVLLSLLVAVSFGWLVVGAHWLITSTGDSPDRLHGWAAWMCATMLAIVGYIVAIGLGALVTWGVCGWLDWLDWVNDDET